MTRKSVTVTHHQWCRIVGQKFVRAKLIGHCRTCLTGPTVPACKNLFVKPTPYPSQEGNCSHLFQAEAFEFALQGFTGEAQAFGDAAFVAAAVGQGGGQDVALVGVEHIAEGPIGNHVIE